MSKFPTPIEGWYRDDSDYYPVYTRGPWKIVVRRLNDAQILCGHSSTLYRNDDRIALKGAYWGDQCIRFQMQWVNDLERKQEKEHAHLKHMLMELTNGQIPADIQQQATRYLSELL